ncbi:uncharacterized protein LOC135076259 [Ostrinia nubilalis]|uniref:uncharacterized protein LOC135076259 n=1 Tax=Ostrinia nubilalis TaxID=29057 RepID=UPI0030826115
MSYPIKFLSLQKAELQYEVELRGSSGESVQELRKEIVKLSQLLPPEDILESHLAASDDLKEVKESLIKSQNNLANLKTKFDKNLFNRTETLLNHLYHRINRIVNVAEINDVYKVCVSNFNMQFKELSSLKSSSTQASNANPTNDTSIPTTISVTCERSLTSDIPKLKFNGNTCVHAFIQKVEEFVCSRGISFEKILSLAYEIFDGDALHWFRYNKDKVSSWPELRTLLKQDFSSSDYDYKFMEEIRTRTQGEHENITIYLSIMHGMFSRLNKPLTEETQLEIILHNIRPCYANTLAAAPASNIKSIEDLRAICLNYERVNSRFSNFREPPKVSSNTIAPEFSYKPKPNYTNNNNKNEPTTNNYKRYDQPKPSTSFYNNSYRNNKQYNDPNKYKYGNSNQNQMLNIAALNAQSFYKVFCPRCRLNNHSLKDCKQDRFPICFKCGKKDVIYPDCSDCHPQANENQKN